MKQNVRATSNIEIGLVLYIWYGVWWCKRLFFFLSFWDMPRWRCSRFWEFSELLTGSIFSPEPWLGGHPFAQTDPDLYALRVRCPNETEKETPAIVVEEKQYICIHSYEVLHVQKNKKNEMTGPLPLIMWTKLTHICIMYYKYLWPRTWFCELMREQQQQDTTSTNNAACKDEYIGPKFVEPTADDGVIIYIFIWLCS